MTKKILVHQIKIFVFWILSVVFFWTALDYFASQWFLAELVMINIILFMCIHFLYLFSLSMACFYRKEYESGFACLGAILLITPAGYFGRGLFADMAMFFSGVFR